MRCHGGGRCHNSQHLVEFCNEDILDVAQGGNVGLDNLEAVAEEEGIVTGGIVQSRGQVGEGLGLGFAEGLEDSEDGVDEVELYDSAPEDLLFAEGVGCVVELELAQGGGLA